MNQELLRNIIITGVAAASLAGCSSLKAPGAHTTFFITSANSGRGGDLGGLAGADAVCESLAAAAGVGGRDWRAYLRVRRPAAGLQPSTDATASATAHG